MRVGIDARFIDRSYPGIGSYLSNLIPALVREPGPVELYVLHRPGQLSRELVQLVDANRSAHAVLVRARPRSLAEQVEIPRLARRLGIDVFHAPYVLAPLRMPCPVTVGVYDLIPLRSNGGLASPLRRAAFRQLVHLSLRRAATVVTLSEAGRLEICTAFPRSSAHVFVTPAAAGSEFRPFARDEAIRLLAPLRVPPRFVLCVGTDRPHKNLPRLIDAWCGLGAERRGAHLLLAGSSRTGAAQAHARVLGGAASDIRFLGRVAQELLPALYSAARLVVLPSLAEGFGLPVLEAMACGTPVACSNTPALREVAGGAALHFEPGDVDSIAEALRLLLADDSRRASLARAGRQRARDFDWRRTAAATRDVYAAAFRAAGRAD